MSNYLLVVLIMSGKNFPKRLKDKLLVRANVNGEVMSTNPTEHTNLPDFNTELVWEVSSKSLHNLRVNRTPIKLNCYLINHATNSEESIGHIILNTRQAHLGVQDSRWYPLLNCKYPKPRPELLLSLYLEEDHNTNPENEPKPEIQDLNLPYPPIEELKPVHKMGNVGGYFQIGPEEMCTDMFVFSVTIVFATNLSQLMPQATFPATSKGMFFYYSLLGNDVTTEPFKDLSEDFPAERASVYLHSSVKMLTRFFQNQPGLQIHICSGDMSLGSAEIALKDLLKNGSSEIFMKPVLVEGMFPITPSRAAKVNNANPCELGVSVSLRIKDDMTNGNVHVEEVPVQSVPSSPKARSKLPNQSFSPPVKLLADGKESNEKINPAFTPPKSRFEENKVRVEARKFNPPTKESDGIRIRQNAFKESPPLFKFDNMNITNFGYLSDNLLHHYCITVDLRSVQLVEKCNFNCYFSFSYPLFGTLVPANTFPMLEVNDTKIYDIPNGLCHFNFSATEGKLIGVLNSLPLVIEMYHHDKNTQDSRLLGKTALALNQLLDAKRSRIQCEEGKFGWRKIVSFEAQVDDPYMTNVCVAEIFAVVSVDDLGPISTNNDVAPHNPQTANQMTDFISREATLQVVFELEQWKEKQEQKFLEELKQKEQRHLHALTEAWTSKESVHEELVHKRFQECNVWEEKLQTLLKELEKRDRALRTAETALEQERMEFGRMRDSWKQDVVDSNKRLLQDSEYKNERLTKEKKDAEQEISRHKEQISALEKKLKAKDAEFQKYKESEKHRPEAVLQSEVNLLNLEKAELERKMEAANQAKMRYKQQWKHCLKDLNKANQAMQEEARMNLQREKQEIAHLRIRMQANEEGRNVEKEKKELSAVRQELETLKQKTSKFGDVFSERPSTSSTKYESEKLASAPHTSRDDILEDDELKNHGVYDKLSELLDRREQLLKIDKYPSHHRKIQQLDSEINELFGCTKMPN